MNQRNHRRHERNVVNERGGDRTHPQNYCCRPKYVAASLFNGKLRHFVYYAHVFKRADEYEKPREKKYRKPFNFAQNFCDHCLVVRVRDEQEQARARQCNCRRLQMQTAVQDEKRNRERQDRQTFFHECYVRDLRSLIQAHNFILQFFVRV